MNKNLCIFCEYIPPHKTAEDAGKQVYTETILKYRDVSLAKQNKEIAEAEFFYKKKLSDYSTRQQFHFMQMANALRAGNKERFSELTGELLREAVSYSGGEQSEDLLQRIEKELSTIK